MLAEGPQVLRRTQWLHRRLAGRRLFRCDSSRPDIPAESLIGQRVQRAFCKGKHIFVELDSGRFLHNHLLMRGRWRKLDGQQLFLSDDVWLGLYVGPYTICNLNGQKLRLVERPAVDEQLESLGPDAMTQPYPAASIRESLSVATLPVSEALLDQSIIAGIGNIAKSELLHAAQIDPLAPACELSYESMDALLAAIHQVLWRSYNAGGRWLCEVYQKQGRPCGRCGAAIRRLTTPPSNRATFYCPACQSRTSRSAAERGLYE